MVPVMILPTMAQAEEAQGATKTPATILMAQAEEGEVTKTATKTPATAQAED